MANTRKLGDGWAVMAGNGVTVLQGGFLSEAEAERWASPEAAAERVARDEAYWERQDEIRRRRANCTHERIEECGDGLFCRDCYIQITDATKAGVR